MLDGCANPLPHSIVPPPMKLFTRIFKEKPANHDIVAWAENKKPIRISSQKDNEKPTFKFEAKVVPKQTSSAVTQVGPNATTRVSLREVSLSKSRLSNLDLQGGESASPTKARGFKPLRISRKLSPSKGTKIDSQEATTTILRRDSVEEGPGRRQTVITQQGASTLHKNFASTCTTAGSQIRTGKLDLNPSFRFIAKKPEFSSRSILKTEMSQLGGQIQNSLMTNTFKDKEIPSEPRCQLPGGLPLRQLVAPKSLGLLVASPTPGEPSPMSLPEQPPSLHTLEGPASVHRRHVTRPRMRSHQKWVDPGSRVEDIIISFQKDL